MFPLAPPTTWTWTLGGEGKVEGLLATGWLPQHSFLMMHHSLSGLQLFLQCAGFSPESSIIPHLALLRWLEPSITCGAPPQPFQDAPAGVQPKFCERHAARTKPAFTRFNTCLSAAEGLARWASWVTRLFRDAWCMLDSPWKLYSGQRNGWEKKMQVASIDPFHIHLRKGLSRSDRQMWLRIRTTPAQWLCEGHSGLHRHSG